MKDSQPHIVIIRQIEESPLVWAAITEAVHRYYYDNILIDERRRNNEALQLASDLLSNLWNLYPDWRLTLTKKANRYNADEVKWVPIESKPKKRITPSFLFSFFVHRDVNDMLNKVQNLEPSVATGDASSNVVGNITDYEKQLEEKFLPEIIAANKQYSLSEVKERWSDEELEQKMYSACNVTIAGTSTIFRGLAKNLVAIAKEYASLSTPNKEEGIDVSSDSKPDNQK